MDLYFLNFKKILVVLTDKTMRAIIMAEFEEQRIDVGVKFVDSYLEAAKSINEEVHDPYDHVILNLSFQNRKLNDFVEFITEKSKELPNFLIEFTQEGELFPVDLANSEEDDGQ